MESALDVLVSGGKLTQVIHKTIVKNVLDDIQKACKGQSFLWLTLQVSLDGQANEHFLKNPRSEYPRMEAMLLRR